MKIAIIDYGMGNIHSVAKAIQLCGGEVLVTGDVERIKSADKLLLPGVGAFDEAMEELKKMGLVEVIMEQAKSGKPLLGICLGMQLLLESSQEAKVNRGLGLLAGEVVKFSSAGGLKVPHMGWNECRVVSGDCPLLRGMPEDSQVYYCHSYYPEPSDRETVAATCGYGKEFACVLHKGNIYGAQFHPEKSQEAGLRLVRNFVELC
ncbi:MAG: imidazole glycerol phosphate synthase subunit HisH [Candidatus Omnitrophota bacterium]